MRVAYCVLRAMISTRDGKRSMPKSIKTISRWLSPGMGVKRWMLALFFGAAIIAFGVAILLRNLFGDSGYPLLLQWVALQALPRWARAIIFGGLGSGLILLALYRLNQTIWMAVSPTTTDIAAQTEMLRSARRRRRGPRIVTIGGGTGMSMLLRGLKNHTDNLTAIVTMADDGGSSGRLRESLGMPPPGDIRNCIAALADGDALTTQLFQYRFGKNGNGNQSDLDGHSFGNLFISAMTGVTGSFERAVAESGKVLAIRGNILPSTLENVTLFADVAAENGSAQVRGESAIPHSPYPIERVYLKPDNPRAFPNAIHAILKADAILLGPGSLFTSLLPNLLVPDIARAIRASEAPKIYIANVATQLGETDKYTLQDHISAIETHMGRNFFTHILLNNNFNYPLPSSWSLNLVIPENTDKIAYELITADVIDTAQPWRHDSQKLAEAFMKWYQTETRRRDK